jgi:hypothetical protein
MLGFLLKQRVTTGVATTNQPKSKMNKAPVAIPTMPTTTNESWGFWGTMNEKAQSAWPLAMTAVADATGQSLESVQTFLDSRHGRHFADDVNNALFLGANLQDAIKQATQRWMGWTISRQTSKEYGIPKGLPYLTGFVIHCDICEELAA